MASLPATSSADRAALGTHRDGYPYRVAPLGPAAVVVAYLGEPEQMGQDEPGVAGPLADPAVGDHVIVRGEPLLALVDVLQILPGLEGAVLGSRPGPRHAGRAWDVPPAHRALLSARPPGACPGAPAPGP